MAIHHAGVIICASGPPTMKDLQGQMIEVGNDTVVVLPTEGEANVEGKLRNAQQILQEDWDVHPKPTSEIKEVVLLEEGVKLPFHESVLEAIATASSDQLEFLATLIKKTKIPKGHDAIIEAWNKRREGMAWGDEDLGVPADILKQKAQVEEKK